MLENRRKIAILSDSTADLNEEFIKEYDIKFLPLHVNFGDKEYLDKVNIKNEDIFNWAETNGELAKTSAVSLGAAINLINETLENYEKVLFFTISSKLSSTFKIVQMAGEQSHRPEDVKVIDSLNLATGISMLILKAGDMIDKGLDIEEIEKSLDAIKDKVGTSFVIDSLKYLKMGGRCTGIEAFAGSALKLHPKIVMKNGELGSGKKYRGQIDRVITNYSKEILENYQDYDNSAIFLTYVGVNEKLLSSIYDEVVSLNYFENVYLIETGSVISSHCGPGTFGMIYLEK